MSLSVDPPLRPAFHKTRPDDVLPGHGAMARPAESRAHFVRKGQPPKGPPPAPGMGATLSRADPIHTPGLTPIHSSSPSPVPPSKGHEPPVAPREAPMGPGIRGPLPQHPASQSPGLGPLPKMPLSKVPRISEPSSTAPVHSIAGTGMLPMPAKPPSPTEERPSSEEKASAGSGSGGGGSCFPQQGLVFGARWGMSNGMGEAGMGATLMRGNANSCGVAMGATGRIGGMAGICGHQGAGMATGGCTASSSAASGAGASCAGARPPSSAGWSFMQPTLHQPGSNPGPLPGTHMRVTDSLDAAFGFRPPQPPTATKPSGSKSAPPQPRPGVVPGGPPAPGTTLTRRGAGGDHMGGGGSGIGAGAGGLLGAAPPPRIRGGLPPTGSVSASAPEWLQGPSSGMPAGTMRARAVPMMPPRPAPPALAPSPTAPSPLSASLTAPAATPMRAASTDLGKLSTGTPASSSPTHGASRPVALSLNPLSDSSIRQLKPGAFEEGLCLPGVIG